MRKLVRHQQPLCCVVTFLAHLSCSMGGRQPNTSVSEVCLCCVVANTAVSLAESFRNLADIIVQFPLVASESHFIFVPGPTDPWDGTTLPRSALPGSISKQVTSRIPKAVFATSPCRIQYLGQEIVVMREDMMSKMLRNTICIKSEEERRTEDAARKEHIEDTRRDERSRGVSEEDLTLPLRSSVLQEYVSLCLRLIGHA